MSALVWFQRDLRLKDNEAFSYACKHFDNIIPLYILDEKTKSAQKWWLHHSLKNLQKNLKEKGLDLILRKGNEEEILKELTKKHDIKVICWNKCYEPDFLKRDELFEKKFSTKIFKGNLLFEPQGIQTTQGTSFKVFTPFWKHCLQFLPSYFPKEINKYPKMISTFSDDLESWKLISPYFGSTFTEYFVPGEDGAEKAFDDFLRNSLEFYEKDRDYPYKKHTSYLSPHLHFGEINVHRFLHFSLSQSFLSQLGWREFSYHLLYHTPSLPFQNFRKEFDHWPWENNPEFLKAWQKGETGFPIIDAGMHELWETGYMHNRIRMLVASFLTKHLLIDWRLGAEWFLDTLLDADLAINSASWQWVTGCGCDAAPYFRIFNPSLQIKKFDPLEEYVKRWNKNNTTKPIVDHLKSRNRALKIFETLPKKSTTTSFQY